MKNKILEAFKERPRVNESLLDSLYEDALADVLELTHRKESIPEMAPVIKDIIAYRLATLGTEGIKSEGYSGISYSYSEDYPPRIMRRIRSMRLYGGIRKEEEVAP